MKPLGGIGVILIVHEESSSRALYTIVPIPNAMKTHALQELFTFKSIFDGLEDAVICHDLDLTITNWNSAAERLFGYTRHEAIGQSVFKLMTGPQYEEQDDMVKDLITKGRNVTQFYTIRKTNTGEELPVSITISPITNEKGEVIGGSQIIRNITSEKLAQEQQAMLAAIIAGSEDAIISKTLEGIITSWNKGAQAIFGYEADEVIGRHVTMLMPTDKLHEEDYIISNVRQGKKIEHFQTLRLAKDGTLIPISLTVSPVTDQAGNIIGVSKIARNITAQTVADEKQAALAAIVESSDDAIISKNLDGIITTWNTGAENIFGYKEDEAIGKHISLLLPRERLQEEDVIIGKIKAGEKVDHFQTVRLRKDGTELQVSLTISPIRKSDGTIIGASKVARDITAHRAAEQALEKQAERLLILNSIGKSISEKLEVDAILQKVTDATTQLTGAAFGAFFYNKTDTEGESYMLYSLSGAPREAFEKFGVPRNTAVFHMTFSGEGVVRVDDITKDPRYGKMGPHYGMPKGHLPVVSYLAVPVISLSGNVIGGLFFGHPEPGVFLPEHEDLVVNVASQAAIALDNSKLFEEVLDLNRKKDEFIAMASHELKTPLTSMNGFLQILQRTAPEGMNKHFLDKTSRQLEKLNILVNDLFDISKVQAGKLQFDFEDFDLGLLIREICDTFEHSTPGHQFVCELEPNLLISGDQIRLEQVLTNLIANAVKYAPESPQINIAAKNKGKEIVVGVTDNGPGISKENQAHIFTQFYRVRDRDRHISGLGLGLYITREIVERHGGRIWVESEPGKGASFLFTIPRDRTEH
ncbi:MAG: domain S-box protein [Mucilaginibacter sp.]|nr:domain S-box protein [Mucilaginibacter sp.]